MTRVHAIQIDAKAGSAYLYFERPSKGTSYKQVNIADSLIFDFGKDGRLIGIEILDPRLAKEFAKRSARQALRRSRFPVRRPA